MSTASMPTNSLTVSVVIPERCWFSHSESHFSSENTPPAVPVEVFPHEGLAHLQRPLVVGVQVG